MDEFEDRFRLFVEELTKIMNVRQEYTSEEHDIRVSRKRSLQPRHILFFFFNVLNAGVKDRRGLQKMGSHFCLSVGAFSNNIPDVAVSMLRAMSDEYI